MLLSHITSKNYVTSGALNVQLNGALFSYSKTTAMNTAISNAIQPLATSASVLSSLVPYSTTTLMNTAISNAIQPLATSASVIASLVPYSTTTLMNTAISNAIQPLATSASVLSSLVPYSTTTLMNTAITSATTNLLATTNIWTSSNVFRGLFISTQSADTILPVSFSSTPSFSMTTGMVYNLSTNTTPLTSLTLTNIPTTPQQTYVFTFVLLPSTVSSPLYLKPPTNFINITPEGSSTVSVPLYGISSVVFPSSYTYILQTITVINTSTTTSPTFIAFLSVSAY